MSPEECPGANQTDNVHHRNGVFRIIGLLGKKKSRTKLLQNKK